MNKNKILSYALSVLVLTGFAACDDDKSYSDLLNEEEHAVNWYLSNHTVELEIPSDGKFLTGPNAPYYKMDQDGFVYMQVLDPGNMNNRPEKGQRLYVRYLRKNIKTMFETGSAEWDGNAGDLNNMIGSVAIIYGNTQLTSTTNYGEGIQIPLKYLGYDSRVNLVIKSPQGFTIDASTCLPYLYDVRYFKSEY